MYLEFHFPAKAKQSQLERVCASQLLSQQGATICIPVHFKSIPSSPSLYYPIILQIVKDITRDKNSQLKCKSYSFLYQLQQIFELAVASYNYAFAHDEAWYIPVQGLIYIQLQHRNQTAQAGIGLHFIAIVISESRRKKSVIKIRYYSYIPISF